MTQNANDEIRIGVSACLLGEKSASTAGTSATHSWSRRLGGSSSRCRSARRSIGLGIPRESMRLERPKIGVRLVTRKERHGPHRGDDALRRATVARRCRPDDLCGYILKKNSPSCGMERVKIYDPQRHAGREAGAACSRRPCCRASRRCPSKKKAGCPTRTCARTSSSASSPTAGCARYSAGGGRLGDVVEFHTAHKLHCSRHAPHGLHRARTAWWRARRNDAATGSARRV